MVPTFICITAVLLVATIVWGIYLFRWKEQQDGKCTDFLTTLLSTLLAVFLPVTVGFAILQHQERVAKEEAVKRYKLLVQAELAGAHNALLLAADRPVNFQSGSSSTGLAFYCQYTLLEEAAKSGLFPFVTTSDMDATVGAMRLFNIIARDFVEGDVAVMPEALVRTKTKDLMDMRRNLQRDIAILGKDLGINWMKAPELPK